VKQPQEDSFQNIVINKIKNIAFLTLAFIGKVISINAQVQDSLLPITGEISLCLEKIKFDQSEFTIIPIEQFDNHSSLLYSSNANFWKVDAQLDPDSFLVVNKESREIIDIIHKSRVLGIEKGGNLKELARLYGFIHKHQDSVSIKFVRGRKGFFNFDSIGPKLQNAFYVFSEIGVNPNLAQLLLLIESPNNPDAVSVSGARGHFQLMPSVARRYGLKVNRWKDERTDFNKSAKAAAKLIKKYCIPQAEIICRNMDIKYSPTELWFQLLALHIYNAGAGTVSKAVYLYKGKVSEGGVLIRTLWNTNYGRFGNSSQNYTQVALGSYLAYRNYLDQKSTRYYSELTTDNKF